MSKKKNLTIIYVTHYVEEIIPLFQKTLLLKQGHIFAKGETAEMFTDAMMQELLGYPAEITRETDGTYRMHVATQSALAKLLK